MTRLQRRWSARRSKRRPEQNLPIYGSYRIAIQVSWSPLSDVRLCDVLRLRDVDKRTPRTRPFTLCSRFQQVNWTNVECARSPPADESVAQISAAVFHFLER